MAISRHDPEWKRAVFMAIAGGVVFKQARLAISYGKWTLQWVAIIPSLNRTVAGASKYAAARNAVHILAENEFLPDAAKPQTARSGLGRNRTEEFTP